MRWWLGPGSTRTKVQKNMGITVHCRKAHLHLIIRKCLHRENEKTMGSVLLKTKILHVAHKSNNKVAVVVALCRGFDRACITKEKGTEWKRLLLSRLFVYLERTLYESFSLRNVRPKKLFSFAQFGCAFEGNWERRTKQKRSGAVDLVVSEIFRNFDTFMLISLPQF